MGSNTALKMVRNYDFLQLWGICSYKKEYRVLEMAGCTKSVVKMFVFCKKISS